MASYGNADRSERDGGRRPGQTAEEARDSNGGDTAISRLPGIVNDLPEVAPHEWIYIMG